MKNQDFKSIAIEISNKFSFAEFEISAEAESLTKVAGGASSCANHLDDAFIALLTQGSHLDLARMPL